jgi:hypothetical protein
MTAPAQEPRDLEDQAWQEARERGELPPLEGKRAAAYEQLQELIRQLPDEASRRVWKEKLAAAIKADAVARDEHAALLRRRGRLRWLAAAGAGLAAAAAVLLWMRRPLPLLPSDEIVVELERATSGATARRGDVTTAAVGDTLLLTVHDRGTTELRVYRDDRELALRCPGAAGCARRGRLLFARLPITAPGLYRALTVEPAPAARPTGALVEDLKACRCTVRPAAPITAR